jgi:hypothetical protein
MQPMKQESSTTNAPHSDPGQGAPYTPSVEGPSQLDLLAHTVQFYEDDAFLIESVAAFVRDGLAANERVLLFITPQHRQALEQKLGEDHGSGHHLGKEAEVRYFDARDTLAKFMVQDWPEEHLFLSVMKSLLASTSAEKPLRVFGELVALLWVDNKHRAALRLEELWTTLMHQRPFALLCAYSITGFPGRDLCESYLEVCGLHSHVRPTNQPSVSSSAPSRLSSAEELS